jgi:hypothetical protein
MEEAMTASRKREVAAAPYAYRYAPERTALVVIDMQRDFIEPGGFGEALGNDVSRLGAIVGWTAPFAAL